MNKMFKSIHGSKRNKPDKITINNAFDRFVKQNKNSDIFYFVVNGIAMPLAFSRI